MRIGFDLLTLLKMNFKSIKSFPILQKIPQFYQDILLIYNNCKTVRPLDQCSPFHCMTQIIWGNENFKQRGQCLYFKSWIDAGLIYVKDVLDANGQFISEQTLLQKVQNHANWMIEFLTIKRALKGSTTICESENHKHINILKHAPSLYHKGKYFTLDDKKSRFFYLLLLKSKFQPAYMQKVWQKKLNIKSLKFQCSWKQIFTLKLKKINE